MSHQHDTNGQRLGPYYESNGKQVREYYQVYCTCGHYMGQAR